MSSLVYIFGKGMRRFRSNYLDLLHKRQDIRVIIFTSLFNFSYNSVKLEQNDTIDFSKSFLLKLSLGEQWIPNVMSWSHVTSHITDLTWLRQFHIIAHLTSRGWLNYRSPDFIRKLYLDPIHLADPGSTQSNPIYSRVLFECPTWLCL